MDIIRWNPGYDLARMGEELSRAIQYPFSWLERRTGPWQPSIDISETDKDVIVKADIPGIKPEDVDIRVSEDFLTIRGEMRRETEDTRQGYYYSERRYGSFFRSVPLPHEVKPDDATASYRDGIVEITIPKAETSRAHGRRVEIRRIQ